MWDRVMSSRDEFREETPQNLTPKFLKDMVVDVMENNKLLKCFK
jgi:hypothetical protein